MGEPCVADGTDFAYRRHQIGVQSAACLCAQRVVDGEANEADDKAGYAEFEETMVTARNHNMVAHAVPILDRGGAFVAVGAPGVSGTTRPSTVVRHGSPSLTTAAAIALSACALAAMTC